MNEKNTKATETVEVDPGMSVMPELSIIHI